MVEKGNRIGFFGTATELAKRRWVSADAESHERISIVVYYATFVGATIVSHASTHGIPPSHPNGNSV